MKLKKIGAVFAGVTKPRATLTCILVQDIPNTNFLIDPETLKLDDINADPETLKLDDIISLDEFALIVWYSMQRMVERVLHQDTEFSIAFNVTLCLDIASMVWVLDKDENQIPCDILDYIPKSDIRGFDQLASTDFYPVVQMTNQSEMAETILCKMWDNDDTFTRCILSCQWQSFGFKRIPRNTGQCLQHSHIQLEAKPS